MKIKLLKNHFGHIEGTILDVTDNRGNYLIRTGVGILDKKNPKAWKESYKKPVSKFDK